MNQARISRFRISFFVYLAQKERTKFFSIALAVMIVLVVTQALMLVLKMNVAYGEVLVLIHQLDVVIMELQLSVLLEQVG